MGGGVELLMSVLPLLTILISSSDPSAERKCQVEKIENVEKYVTFMSQVTFSPRTGIVIYFEASSQSPYA